MWAIKCKSIVLMVGVFIFTVFLGNIAWGTEIVQPEKANINWRQCEGQTLTILDMAYFAGPILTEFEDEFEELTGIKINHILMDEDKVRLKRTEDCMAGAGRYDIYALGLTIIPQYYEARWVENLRPFIENPSLTDPAFFDYEGIAPGLRNGQVYGDGYVCAIPNMFCGTHLYYRTDILSEAGMYVANNWDDFINVYMPKLKNFLDANGYNMAAFGTRGKKGPGANTAFASAVHRDYGGEWFDENGKPIFNSPEGVKALEVYAALHDPERGAPIGGEGIGMYEIIQMFYLGQVASAWTAGSLQDTYNDPTTSTIVGKWDGAPLPWGPANWTSLQWTWAYGMSKFSKKKEAAWLYIQWATSPATMSKWGSRCPPPRINLLRTEPWMKMRQECPGFISATEWALYFGMPDCQPLIPEFPEWGEYYGTAVSNVIAGRQKPQEALDWAVQEVTKAVGYVEKD